MEGSRLIKNIVSIKWPSGEYCFNSGSSHRGMQHSRMGKLDAYSGVPGIFGGYIKGGSGVAK